MLVRHLCAVALVAGSAVACGVDEPFSAPNGPQVRPPDPPPSFAVDVLVFTGTAGYRHESIVDAQSFFATLPSSERIRAVVTDDPAAIAAEVLDRFDVVAFVNTSGDVLDEAAQTSMEAFVRGGGGFVGVHAAADTEHDWAWYGRLVGAYFVNHPRIPLLATLSVEAGHHPAAGAFADGVRFEDEWYNFDRNPRADNVVLLTVDEADFTEPNTPSGPSMGGDHPVSWYKQFDGGRSFYTNLGHRPETWRDLRFQRHLLAGIRWASRPNTVSRTILTREPRNPLALAVAPDGRVVYIERTGEIRVVRPETGRDVLAARVPVELAAESGLLGLALDPDFATNQLLYIYYSAPSSGGALAENVLARAELRDDDSVDTTALQVLLRVPSDRQCCHEGGSLAFGPDGSLFLSTGDNTNPFESAGAAPLDARAGREAFDSRRTAANPFDLRGKVLRIRPDGSIPPGNLFPSSGEFGRAEIYAMGVRNPFRIAVDQQTGRLYFGDVGPDAREDSSRGPRGYDELNSADSPGDYGWPFCIAENLAYTAWDFETNTAGERFDCSEKRPAALAYDYSTRRYAAFGSGYDQAISAPGPETAFEGRTLLAGAVYRAAASSEWAFPRRFDGAVIVAEWARHLLVAAQFDASGKVSSLERLVPFEAFRRPVDVEIGPDGAIYVLEYGSGFWGDNADAGLSRLEYSEAGELAPEAVARVTSSSGAVPLLVELSASESRARGRSREVTRYEWDLDGDGLVDSSEPIVSHRYDTAGFFFPTLRVFDEHGRMSTPFATRVVVGNRTPEVAITSPANGSAVTAGGVVALQGHAVDAEDGVAACAALTWDIRLGHNAHAHPVQRLTGCAVSFLANAPDHGGADALFYAVELTYEDRGGPGGLPSLRGSDRLRIELAR